MLKILFLQVSHQLIALAVSRPPYFGPAPLTPRLTSPGQQRWWDVIRRRIAPGACCVARDVLSRASHVRARLICPLRAKD